MAGCEAWQSWRGMGAAANSGVFHSTFFLPSFQLKHSLLRKEKEKERAQYCVVQQWIYFAKNIAVKLFLSFDRDAASHKD